MITNQKYKWKKILLTKLTKMNKYLSTEKWTSFISIIYFVILFINNSLYIYLNYHAFHLEASTVLI